MSIFATEEEVKASMFSAQSVGTDGDMLVCVHKGYTETFIKRRDAGYDRVSANELQLTMRD